MMKPAYDAVHDKASREDDAMDVHVVYGLHALYILLTDSEQMHRRRILSSICRLASLSVASPLPPSLGKPSKKITQIPSFVLVCRYVVALKFIDFYDLQWMEADLGIEFLLPQKEISSITTKNYVRMRMFIFLASWLRRSVIPSKSHIG